MSQYIISTTKRAIILQIGEFSIKGGLSSEASFRKLVLSPELVHTQQKSTYLQKTPRTVSEYELLYQEALSTLFLQYLQIPTENHTVIFLEHHFFPTPKRQAIVNVLFKYFKIASITFLSEMISPLYLCVADSGLIIDVGYNETRILPISYGVPINKAFRVLPVGSQTVDSVLFTMLLDHYEEMPDQSDLASQIHSLSISQIDHCKILSCYVRFRNSQEALNSSFQVQLNNSLTFTVPPHIRWIPCEVLFQKTSHSEFNMLSEQCLESIGSCDMQIREQIVSNIVCCGGGATLRGFKYRLAHELRCAFDRTKTLKYLMKSAQFCEIGCSEYVRQWVGASLFGGAGLDGLADHQTYQKSEWTDAKPLPDWCVPQIFRCVESPTTFDLMNKLTSYTAKAEVESTETPRL